MRQRNFPIVRGGSPEPPRELPAAGAFMRHFCAAGQETRRAKLRCSGKPHPVTGACPPAPTSVFCRNSCINFPWAAVSKGEGRHRSEGYVRSVLERVYRDHRQGLFTLALAITRCPHRAEDAVQEAMARLWQSTELPQDPVPYAFSAVRNAAIDQTRRAAVRHRLETASIFGGFQAAAHTDDPAGAAITAEQHARIRQAVDALPQPEREVVAMRVYGGLKFEQIAEALDEPLPTVASRYRRALDTLSRRVRPAMEASHE